MTQANENGKVEVEEAVYPNWPARKVALHLRPHKSNSTSTLFIDSTISSPKTPELVRCIAEYFTKRISPSDKTSPEERASQEIFDESKYPLTSRKVDVSNSPPLAMVEKYIRDVYKVGQLAPESLIMAVAYIDRIEETSKLKLFGYNWRRCILANMILASKVWEDQAVWNVDFIDMFPCATPHDLGQMEKKLLSLLTIAVSLKASQYATIYFDLRAQSASTGEHFHELLPLNKDGQERLELITSNYGEKHIGGIKRIPRSTGSFDNLNGLKSPRAVLN